MFWTTVHFRYSIQEHNQKRILMLPLSIQNTIRITKKDNSNICFNFHFIHIHTLKTKIKKTLKSYLYTLQSISDSTF